MRTAQKNPQLEKRSRSTASSGWSWLTAFAAFIGLALLVDTSLASSATYDEVTYLRVAARWWRTGDQSEITQMGSPLTFWKLQQVPVLWLLDHLGHHNWIDDPVSYQQRLLPLIRLGSSWIWLMAFTITVFWSRRSCGPRAMVFAAWLFALSPNLLAHGALATMELPLILTTTAMFHLFWQFLQTERAFWFWITATLGGLAFSCKFTAILIPPILGILWWVIRWKSGECRPISLNLRIAVQAVGFLLIMLISNVSVTGFACLTLSNSRGCHPTIDKWFGSSGGNLVASIYETPLPQDCVGFVNQLRRQASGGPSYLFGERRMYGWWYYYLVAMVVKTPLVFWLLTGARLAISRCASTKLPVVKYDDLLPLALFLYISVTAVGSLRNYGVRYLLPLGPLAIVWVSGLAEQRHACASRTTVLARSSVLVGIAGYVVAVAGIHPHELAYINILGGGSRGGRCILADSNFDWGQGLMSLARLQQDQSEFLDMTLYYFGDTGPAYYGVAGHTYVINAVDDQSELPGLESVKTQYLAVSASLQWGPWGPRGFFDILDHLEPVQLTDDTTIAIYRTIDMKRVSKIRASDQ